MEVNSNVTPLNVSINQSDTIVCTGKVKVKHKELSVLEFSKEGYHSDYKYFYPDKIRPIVKLESFLVFPFLFDMVTGNVMKISADNIFVNLLPRFRFEDSVDMIFGNIEFAQVYKNGLGDYKVSYADSEVSYDQLYPLFTKVSKTNRIIEDAIVSECQYSGVKFVDSDLSLSLDIKMQDISATTLIISNFGGGKFEKSILKTNVLFTISVFGERLIAKAIDENTLSYHEIDKVDEKSLIFYNLMQRNLKKSVTKFLSDDAVIKAINDYISNQDILFQFDTDMHISFPDYNSIISSIRLNGDIESTGVFINPAGYFMFIKPLEDVQSVNLTLSNGISLSAKIVENIQGKPYGIGKVKINSGKFAVFSTQDIFETNNLVVVGQRDGGVMFKEDQYLHVKNINDQTILESDKIEFKTGDLICSQDGKVMGFVCINEVSKIAEYYNISSLITN